MSGVFSAKLDGLPKTVRLAAVSDVEPLARALWACESHPVVAVGSGGSAISAEFLAACRAGLGHGPTLAVTPMAYVLETTSTAEPVWLFSASGQNNDIIAALMSTRESMTPRVDVLTSGKDGALAKLASEQSTAHVHLTPVSDPKDGFIATHSVVSAAVSIVLASDLVAGSIAQHVRAERLTSKAENILSPAARSQLASGLAALDGRDTVFLLYDPHLSAAALLVETSLWEAGICAVQRSDFRNFAHGRHVWMAHHPCRTFVLALTTERSLSMWSSIATELPADIPSAHFDFCPVGRESSFEALLTMFAVIEACAALNGIDPGKPGVADFGRSIFEQADLRRAAEGIDGAVRLKRMAESRFDQPGRDPIPWAEHHARFIAGLERAKIRGVVMDYDGTIVPTSDRLAPPQPEIMKRIANLAENGIGIGIATGRGGSVYEMLYDRFSECLRQRVIIGYYNGAYVAPLAENLEQSFLGQDPAIAAFYETLCAEPDLFVEGWIPKLGRVQITIFLEKLKDGESINRLENLLQQARGNVRSLRSGHSIDVFPGWASKRRVVEALRKSLGIVDTEILRIGDSGDCQGNDFDLLEGALGVSVGKVSHREDSCWNLLPARYSGPRGLLRILSALRVVEPGVARMDVSVLFGI